jgi:hypothetical protein
MSSFPFGNRDSLTKLANRYGSDKGDKVHGCHCYAEIYDRLLGGKRMSTITMLEIGLLHPLDRAGPATRAPSLQMWRTYFPRARLLGFDIKDFSGVVMQNCTIFRGDMGSREDLQIMAKTVGTPFDIIIEDGSHASIHQQISFATLFPYVAQGGLYIIEDLHWSPSEMETEGIPKTRTLLRNFRLTRSFPKSPAITMGENTYLNEHIAAVELFDSKDKRNRQDNRDALGVITKKG